MIPSFKQSPLPELKNNGSSYGNLRRAGFGQKQGNGMPVMSDIGCI